MNRGFKIVTPENWLQPDPLSETIVRTDGLHGSVHPVDGRDWTHYLNEVPLSQRVPQSVRDAYDFAVGAACYAHFYYPLFTLVAQQVLRIADYAVSQLFAMRGDLMKLHARSFAERLTALKEAGHLDGATFARWSAVRQLRNSATHPAWQQTWGHSELSLVQAVAGLISSLPWPDDGGQAPED